MLLPTLLALAPAAPVQIPGAPPELLWRPESRSALPVLDDAENRWREVTFAGSEWLETEGVRNVTIELFDGESITAEMRRIGTPREGSAVWRADLDGDAGSDHMLLSWVDGAVHAYLSVGARDLQIRHTPAGALLTELDPSEFEPCATDHRHEVTAVDEGEGEGVEKGGDPGGGIVAFSSVSDVEEVDVLTAYTPAARQSAGGTAGIESLIDLAIARTNESYGNCDAGLYIRSVHTYEVDYSESSSISTDLSRFRGTNDGFMDEVHGLRNAFGADCCALISNSSGACGVASLMVNVSPFFQSSAFSVTVRSCAVGNLTYAHELGHNFGCAHDRDNAGNSSKPYAYGYRTPNNQFRTVMAYSPGSRKPIFSSPLHQWQGQTMGTANEDNARALTLNAPTIANWRPSVVDTVDCDGNGVSDAVDIALGNGFDLDGDGLLDACENISSDTLQIGLLSGGAQTLFLNAGQENAGDLYVVLGSLSGTSPGTPLFGLELPLVPDAYFTLTLEQGGAGLLQNNFGFLDGEGRAEAVFAIPPTPIFSLILTPPNHAFLTLDPVTLQGTFVSDPEPVFFSFT